MDEARQWIKAKSIEIQKHITKEHHKLIERFIAYKERTDDRIEKIVEMEKRFKELT